MENLSQAIRCIPDFPKPGILFRDITTLLNDPQAFQQAVSAFADRYQGQQVDQVVGVEARGFILGAALALKLSCGFVPIRKKGKLPSETYQATYSLEYGEDTVEIHRDAIAPGSRVVLIDDLLATGGTIAASVELLNHFENLKIAEIAFLIELVDLQGRAELGDLPIYSVLQF